MQHEPMPVVHYQQNNVVTQQPGVVSTTVVTQQHHVMGQNQWSSATCDCFNDMKSCCCALWCGNLYYACVATRMGEHCCVGCSGDSAGCVAGGHLAMRARFRATHNIQGDVCTDCVMMHFCKPCSMCQMVREMDRLGYQPAGCC